MVANESLSMRMIVFPKLWFDLMSSTACEQQRNVDDFIGLLCNSCNYFREYISLILLQDKDFLQYDIVFELIRHCLPMVSACLLCNLFFSRSPLYSPPGCNRFSNVLLLSPDQSATRHSTVHNEDDLNGLLH